MTRFGMKEDHFRQLAGYMQEIIGGRKRIAQEIMDFRAPFQDLQYCFKDASMESILEKLYQLI